MEYNLESLKYQKVLNNFFKKKYKCFISLEVNPLDFEGVIKLRDSVQFLNIDFYWDVLIALENDETLSGLSEYSKNIFHTMFGDSYVVPWINLKSEIK